MNHEPDPRPERPERPAMKAALDALRAAPGPVPDWYRPPVSTLPMTPAAREALRLSRER